MSGLAALVLLASFCGPVEAPRPHETVVLGRNLEIRPSGEWDVTIRRWNRLRILRWKTVGLTVDAFGELQVVSPNGQVRRWKGLAAVAVDSLVGSMEASRPNETVIVGRRMEVRPSGEWHATIHHREGKSVFQLKMAGLTVDASEYLHVISPEGDRYTWRFDGDRIETPFTPPPTTDEPPPLPADEPAT